MMPELPRKLRTARMPDSPEYYVKKTLMTAVMMGVALTIIAFAFLQDARALYLLLLMPMLFFYFLHFVDMRILQLGRQADAEIVYAGRFLIIEIEAGVPLFDTFKNLARNYEKIGVYFQEIVDMVSLGTSTEQAINEMIEFVPSDSLRKMFWQILNSLRTGSEIADSLQIALEQIVREQQIAVVEYGRKLNPMAMFYMMIAVILPSLGITMIIVMATFVGFQLPLAILLTASGLLGFIQFMFLATIRSQRPAVIFS